jgi:hypothetical protein
MNLDPSFSCVSENLVFLTDEGKLQVVWGTRANVRVEEVELPGEVIQVACAERSILALLQNGKVYGWGNNLGDMLGLEQEKEDEGEEETVSTPTLVPLSTREKIIEVKSGGHFSIFRTDQDRLYSFGELKGPSPFYEIPGTIVEISCGYDFKIFGSLPSSLPPYSPLTLSASFPQHFSPPTLPVL